LISIPQKIRTEITSGLAKAKELHSSLQAKLRERRDKTIKMHDSFRDTLAWQKDALKKMELAAAQAHDYDAAAIIKVWCQFVFQLY
jgi:hypothetical protein